MENPKERYRNLQLCKTRVGKCATLGIQFSFVIADSLCHNMKMNHGNETVKNKK
jgi:hypothetical protein